MVIVPGGILVGLATPLISAGADALPRPDRRTYRAGALGSLSAAFDFGGASSPSSGGPTSPVGESTTTMAGTTTIDHDIGASRGGRARERRHDADRSEFATVELLRGGRHTLLSALNEHQRKPRHRVLHQRHPAGFLGLDRLCKGDRRCLLGRGIRGRLHREQHNGRGRHADPRRQLPGRPD